MRSDSDSSHGSGPSHPRQPSRLAGESVELEFRITRPDGEQRWVRAKAQPIVEDGTVARIVGASRDITERKRCESEHIAEIDRPDAPVDAVPDLFYELDENGELARWNDALAAATGYRRDLGPMSLTALFARSDRETVRQGIETAFSTGETSFEADLLTADGTTVPYEFTGGRITAADGSPLGVVGIGRDISARESRRQALEQQTSASERLPASSSRPPEPAGRCPGPARARTDEHDSDHLDAVKRAHGRIGRSSRTS